MASQEELMEQQKAQCPFCKIAAKEIDSHIVYEDEHFMGILDINPAVKGHVLFFPKEHYPIIATIPPDVFTKMSQTVKTLSKKVQIATVSQGVDVFIASGQAAGQQVMHFLLHIIPREQGDPLSKFQLPDATFDPEAMKKTTETLAANLKQIMAGKFQSTEPLSKENVLQLIEQNPQLKQIILEKPGHFRQLVKQNPQMQTLFKNVDVEYVINAVQGEQAKTEDKKEEKKEGKEEKKDDKTLDSISDYLQGL